jgi:hypothetical protein
MLEDPRKKAEFLAILTQARSEWLQAQNYFELVSDPDLVDYAIYQMEAAKLKYMYLIKQARKLGFQNKQILQEEPSKGFN